MIANYFSDCSRGFNKAEYIANLDSVFFTFTARTVCGIMQNKDCSTGVAIVLDFHKPKFFYYFDAT